MNYGSLVLLIVIHIVFDFFFQTREMGKNKSSKLSYLIPHLFIISLGLSIYATFCGRYTHNQGVMFVAGNVILHGVIDWNIWRLFKTLVIFRLSKGKKLYLVTDYKYWEDSMFYNFIAIDQALHAICYLALDYLVRSL